MVERRRSGVCAAGDGESLEEKEVIVHAALQQLLSSFSRFESVDVV